MRAKKPPIKDAQIVIRIEEKDRLALQAEAAAESRKLGDYARLLLLTHPRRFTGVSGAKKPG